MVNAFGARFALQLLDGERQGMPKMELHEDDHLANLLEEANFS